MPNRPLPPAAQRARDRLQARRLRATELFPVGVPRPRSPARLGRERVHARRKAGGSDALRSQAPTGPGHLGPAWVPTLLIDFVGWCCDGGLPSLVDRCSGWEDLNEVLDAHTHVRGADVVQQRGELLLGWRAPTLLQPSQRTAEPALQRVE